MTRTHTRVVIFSSATLFRDGLRTMLEDAPDIEVLGFTGTWETALALVRAHQPDAVIVDRDDLMPANFLDTLFESAARIRVVVLSLQDDRMAVYTQASVEHPRRPELLAAVTQRSRRAQATAS
jgi:DNA-binding NarL/FixJ family response regulator